MEFDPLRDVCGSAEALGQASEPRDFGLTFPADGWLEEHVRRGGSD